MTWETRGSFWRCLGPTFRVIRNWCFSRSSWYCVCMCVHPVNAIRLIVRTMSRSHEIQILHCPRINHEVVSVVSTVSDSNSFFIIIASFIDLLKYCNILLNSLKYFARFFVLPNLVLLPKSIVYDFLLFSEIFPI